MEDDVFWLLYDDDKAFFLPLLSLLFAVVLCRLAERMCVAYSVFAFDGSLF